MGVAMSEAEAWAFLARGHTGILTTLRRDGWPVALPLWFVVDDRRIYVATPSTARKLQRIAHDDRGSFLVETGEAWGELAAVHLPVRARVLDPEDDAEEARRAGRLFAEKYAAFRTSGEKLPAATTKHYRSQRVVRLDPAGPPVSWDNSRIRLR
jgi:PPOX class probable F420-dependent enzyme